MNWFLFQLQYYFFIAIQAIFGRKKRKYVLFIIGRYPENFKHCIKAIIDADSDVRISHGNTIIILAFDTKKKINEVKNILSKIYAGYVDNYMLFDITKGNFAKELQPAAATELFDPDYKYDVNEKLDNFQKLVDSVVAHKNEILKQRQQQLLEQISQEEAQEPQADVLITIEDIDPILEKIKIHGIDSLTDEEKIILQKYNQQ